MQHQVVDIFCTPTDYVVNVFKINVHHFFVSHDFLTGLRVVWQTTKQKKQLFGAYLHVLKSRVDDVWWEKNRGRT